MNLKVETGSGQITTINVERLIEVDGKPYLDSEDTEFLAVQIAKLDGRLTTIERAIFPPHEVTANG